MPTPAAELAACRCGSAQYPAQSPHGRRAWKSDIAAPPPDLAGARAEHATRRLHHGTACCVVQAGTCISFSIFATLYRSSCNRRYGAAAGRSVFSWGTRSRLDRCFAVRCLVQVNAVPVMIKKSFLGRSCFGMQLRGSVWYLHLCDAHFNMTHAAVREGQLYSHLLASTGISQAALQASESGQQARSRAQECGAKRSYRWPHNARKMVGRDGYVDTPSHLVDSCKGDPS